MVTKKQMDSWTYPMFVITMLLLFSNFVMYNSSAITSAELIKNILFYLLPTFVLPIFIGMFAMWLDGRKIKPMAKGLLCYPLFLLTWIFINFKCLFIRNTSWEKIDHVRSIYITYKWTFKLLFLEMTIHNAPLILL